MIVVVAAFPTTENQKDGMLQRIAYIDDLMASMSRTYLYLSFRRFFRKEVLVKGNVTVYRLNVFRHIFLISRILRNADLVYIHSAYNALKVIGVATRAHVIFDAHGIVPEEMAQEGHPWAARIFAIAERSVLRRCNTLVCVTRSMLTHFKVKYGERADREEIVLPILPRVDNSITAAQALQSTRNEMSVVYAGGMQAWQNVDKMLAAAQAQPKMRYTFLTGNQERFESLLKESGIREYECHSVPPDKVKDFYLTHEYGFILRDEVLVNLVSCPTKLVEYLYWGVIPIVLSHHIGDFDVHSLHGIPLDQFRHGDLPDGPTRTAMRQKNQRTVLEMFADAEASRKQLQRRLSGAS